MEPHFFFCNGRVFDLVEKSRHCHTHAALIHRQSLSISTKPGAVQSALRARPLQLLLCHSVPNQCLLPYSGMGAMEPHFFFCNGRVFDHVEKSRHCHKHAALIHHQSLSISTKPGAVQTALNVQLICWTTSEQDPCNSCCATLFQTNACCHIQVWVPWNLISFFCNGRVFDHVEKSRHCHTHAALIHHQSLSGFTKPGAVQTALNVHHLFDHQ